MDSHDEDATDDRAATRSLDGGTPRGDARDNEDPTPGSWIAGRYRVERVLGRGGMGVVVEAEHAALGERVAIKLLRAGNHDATTALRLLREGRAVSRIGAGVVRTRDAGTLANGTPYLVMDLLRGEDVAQRLARTGPLPILEVVDLVITLADVMTEAHRAGVVHRDLKPSNLFLHAGSDGAIQLVVLDFGIAKIAHDDADPSLTSTASVLGSPLYMSPEQIRDARAVDARTDIWSLGVITHELLTGKTPFHAANASAALAKISADKAPSLRLDRPDAPEGLAKIVLRCLHKDPADRFATMQTLRDALAPFGSRGATATTGSLASKRPRLVASALGAAFALVALGTSAFSSRTTPEPPAPPASSAEDFVPVRYVDTPNTPSASSSVHEQVPDTPASIALSAHGTVPARMTTRPLSSASAVPTSSTINRVPSTASEVTAPRGEEIQSATEHRK